MCSELYISILLRSSSLVPVKMVNIFVYGSLMFDNVRDALIGSRYQNLGAFISGYRRLTVKGEVYPGLVESEKGRVDGIVLLGIDSGDLRVLDQFEGHYYRRQSVTVSVHDMRLMQAETYMFRDEYRFMLSDKEWSVDEFRKTGINTFMANYHGLRQSE